MADNGLHWLYEGLINSLNTEWEQYRSKYSNTKGDTYERSLQSFLASYFNGVFDVHNKTALIDKDGASFDIFDYQNGQDEIDLVGTFANSKPNMVFAAGPETAQMKWVPFDAVSFVIEVKSKLTKPALSSDLSKLENIGKLETYEHRFIETAETELTINDHLRCLVYDNASISDEPLKKLLSCNLNDWHMVLIVETNTLLVNTDLLPYARMFSPVYEEYELIYPGELSEETWEQEIKKFESTDIDPDSNIISLHDGLLHFVFALASSTPNPTSVLTLNSFAGIRPESTKARMEATTSVAENSE